MQVVLGVVIIITAKPHATKSEIRFCAGLDPTCSVSEVCNVENLQQWPWLETRFNIFHWSTIP